jgi:uncharacterized membrane protein YdbT with pleckstrin-like domain
MIQLQPDEKIIKIVRRHWYVIVMESVSLAALAILPIIILPVMFSLDIFPFSGQILMLSLFGLACWCFFLWQMFFIFWTNYYLDAWIITNHKIIDIEQHGLFRRDVSNYRLDRVQDITVKIRGLVATWLKFGDIDIQTAGASSHLFIIRHAPNPNEVKNLVMDLQHQAIVAKPATPTNPIG